MTVHIGVVYDKGLVMGSDRLLVDEETGDRSDAQKLYRSNRYIVGYGGTMPERHWEALQIANDLTSGDGDLYSLLLVHVVLKADLQHNEKYKGRKYNFYSVMGHRNGTKFALYESITDAKMTCPGRLKLMATHSIDYTDWYELLEDINEGRSIDFVTEMVRRFERTYPEHYGGLHVIQLTADGTKEIACEKASA